MNRTRCVALVLLLLPAAARADDKAEAADNLAKGRAALADKDPDLAIACFTQALRLDPGSADAYFQRGNAWYDKDEWDRAIADYSDSLRLERDAAVYVNRGLCYSNKKDHDRAVHDFTAALEMDPKNPARVHLLRGDAHYDKGDYDKAIADHGETIRLDPDNAKAYARRGADFRAKHDDDKALADYTRAIELKPTAALYVDRGSVHDHKKDHEKALADFDKARELEPTNPSPENALAWLFATCPDANFRDGKKAVEHATKACELTGWKKPFYFDSLAAAYAEAGDFAQAVKWQQKAAEAPDAFAKDDVPEVRLRLRLYEKGKPYRAE
jgi:tetratricopeptide (TPR) repeat protein